MKSVIDLAEQVKDYAAAGKTIAPVENGTTAVGSYAIGEKFIREGVLYKAKTSITAGDTLTLNTNYELADNVVTEISDVKQALTDLTNLVEGATEITTKSFVSVISVIDALPVNAVDVSAKIEPIQAGSGTPSPSNVRAISGRTEITVTRAGKNIFGGMWSANKAINTADGSIITYNGRSADETFYPVKPNTTYYGYVSFDTGLYVMLLYQYDKDKNIIGSQAVPINRTTFTTVDNAAYIRVVITTATNLDTITSFINYPSTDHDYHKYEGNDYTIQLGDTYYGGTLDVTTGVLTVDKGIIDLGDLTYTYDSTYLRFVSSDISNMKADMAGRSMNLVCSCYEVISDERPIGNVTNNSIYNGGNSPQIIIHDSRYTVPSDLKTAVTGQKVVYPLATPITVQLTPQEIQMLQGNNTIFTDSGDTSIQYYANGVKNLEASVSAIQNDTNDLKALTAIFGTFENGTTASKPYAQGDYFVKDNKMCKAKTSIAKGATLTLNTNYEEKTLAEILKTIETT